MEDVFVGVDPDLEKIYLNILRKLLETPENWKPKEYDMYSYISPPINDESKLYFLTHSSRDDEYLTKIMVMDEHRDIVYDLPIGHFDRKTRNLMKRMYRFMEHRGEWSKSQKANRILKEGLGSTFERFQKLMKIKKKISE